MPPLRMSDKLLILFCCLLSAGIVLIVVGIAFAMPAGAATQSPCEAQHRDTSCHHLVLIGHRFREEPADTTSENTMEALEAVYKGGLRHVEGDFWYTTDGCTVNFHDATYGRVVSADTLKAAGLTSHDNPGTSTCDQVAMLRTKGGDPLPSLWAVMKYSITHKIHLTEEIKNGDKITPARAQDIMTHAKSYGNPAYVRFYGSANPKVNCTEPAAERLKAAGFKIGQKWESVCDVPVSELLKYSFITYPTLTDARVHVKTLQSHGVRIGATITTISDIGKWVAARMDFAVVPHPLHVASYLGHK
jgi:hypothetical protein